MLKETAQSGARLLLAAGGMAALIVSCSSAQGFALNDEATAGRGTPIIIDVLANDRPALGDALQITSVSDPDHGAAINLGTSVLYVPRGRFTSGEDAFVYTTTNGYGATAAASVRIAIGNTRFAVIGNYGTADWGGQGSELWVSELVKSWSPQFILTVGNNNYLDPSDIDRAIGQYYSKFIHPYSGNYGKGADENRFFPTVGDGDLSRDGGKAYLEYFNLPGVERYYDFVWGPVHFFAVNSSADEPHGISAISAQARWLRDALSRSTSAFNVVYMHGAQFSSLVTDGLGAQYRKALVLRWPYPEWGADVVLSGRFQHYERVMRDGFPYVINGLGGHNHISRLGVSAASGSVARFNADFGAMIVDVTPANAEFRFVTRGGDLIDVFVINENPTIRHATPALRAKLEEFAFTFGDGGVFGDELAGASAILSIGSFDPYPLYADSDYVWENWGAPVLSRAQFRLVGENGVRREGIVGSACAFEVLSWFYPQGSRPPTARAMRFDICATNPSDGRLILRNAETGVIAVSGEPADIAHAAG